MYRHFLKKFGEMQFSLRLQAPEFILNIKTVFPVIGIPIVQIKQMILRPPHIYNMNPYISKTASL